MRTSKLDPVLRRPIASLLAVAAVIVLAFTGVMVWRHAPRAPPPLGWDLLAKALIADEFAADSRWNPVLMSRTSTPLSPDRVMTRFQASVNGLDCGWFAHDWNGLAPGQLRALKSAAQAYARAYRLAHASPQITAAFDGQGLPVAETIAEPAESAALLAQLTQLHQAIEAADAPWSVAGAAGRGLRHADRLRAILAARERLSVSEVALLQLISAAPGASSLAVARDGSVRFESGDADIQTKAKMILDARAQAVSDLQHAAPDGANA